MGSQASSRDTRTIEFHWEETPEEKHERVNQILARRTRVPVLCLGCGEDIPDDHVKVDTPHGAYHGAPKTCVNGRDDDDIPWWQN